MTIEQTLINDLETLGLTYDEFMETYEIATLDLMDVEETPNNEGEIIQEEYFNKVLNINFINYYLVINGKKEFCGQIEESNLPKRFEMIAQINEYKRNNNL